MNPQMPIEKKRGSWDVNTLCLIRCVYRLMTHYMGPDNGTWVRGKWYLIRGISILISFNRRSCDEKWSILIQGSITPPPVHSPNLL